jgi:hypothetical protein
MRKQNKRYIELDVNNKVIGEITTWKAPAERFIESELGTLEQIMLEDGTFIDDPVVISRKEKASRVRIINNRLLELKDEKQLYDFGGMTDEEFQPFKVEAVSIIKEKKTLIAEIRASI